PQALRELAPETGASGVAQGNVAQDADAIDPSSFLPLDVERRREESDKERESERSAGHGAPSFLNAASSNARISSSRLRCAPSRCRRHRMARHLSEQAAR